MTCDPPRNFNQLLDVYGDLLKRVAATYEANISKQQDLFQEISLAVWLAMPAYKGNSSFKTYMLRIAHNVSVKHVTNEVKKGNYVDIEQQILEANPSVEGEKNNEQHIQAAQLMHHVRQLPLQHRELFALLMEGLSYKEIAEMTDNSIANVGMLILRIKQRLTEAMSHE